MSSVPIGFAAGALCFLAVSMKFRFGYDDSLDVIGVHLVGGILGSLLLGLFAEKAVNPAGADGVFYGGGFTLLGEQAIAVGATLVYSFVVTGLICLVLKALHARRTADLARSDEETGLDLTSALRGRVRTGPVSRTPSADRTEHR